MHRAVPASLVIILVLVIPAGAQEAADPDGESSGQGERVPPELTEADETGGLMDEFALLEEAIADDEVESASKHRQSIFWSPSAVTVLTRKDILNAAGLSFTDLLRTVPGVDVSYVTPFYSFVNARGLIHRGNNHMLVLIDGREEIIDMTGIALWDTLSIDPEEIERIEVIRGPGSALYGANAFDGVVNITTISEEPTEDEHFRMAGGEMGQLQLFGRYRDRLRVGSGWLSWGVGLGGEQVRESTAPEVIGRGVLRSHGYLRYQTPDLELTLQAGGMTSQGYIMFFFGEMQAREVLNLYVNTNTVFNLTKDIRLRTQLYYSRFSTGLIYRHGVYVYGTWMTDIPDISWISHTADGQVQLEWQIGDKTLLVGGANLRMNTASAEGMIFDSDREFRGAGFLQVNWQASDMVQLTGGVRIDANSVTPLAVSPRAVLVLRPLEKHSFRLGYGLAFRKPSFLESQVHLQVENYNPSFQEVEDLFARGIGNPDLSNIKVNVLEAGWRAHLLDDRLQLSLDLFYNMYSDYIGFIAKVPERMGLPDLANAEVRYLNVDIETSVLGGEWAASWSPFPGWKIWVNGCLRGVFKLERESGVGGGPVFRLNLGGGYLPEAGLVANLWVSYFTSYQTALIDPADPMKISNQMITDDNALLFGRVGYRIARDRNEPLELGLVLRTPLTGEFRELAGVPMPDFLVTDNGADSGGKPIIRLVQFYLCGTF